MQSKNSLTVIIIHWNTPRLLEKQLRELTKNQSFQLIVVDNASNQSLDWLIKLFPRVELIKNKINYGYSFAANQAALRARGEWLLFLNPDVQIRSKTVFRMIDEATRKNLDACSPMVGENYRKPLPSWFSLLVEFSPLKKLINLKNLITSKTLFGGCLLMRKKVLFDLGGWDERFFLWFEDSDLTLRLIRNKYKIGWLKTTIKHRGGTSFKLLDDQLKRDIFFHSMDIFASKHFSWWGRFIVSLIKRRYTSRKLLPALNKTISIIIPNIDKQLLEKFLSRNFGTVEEKKTVNEWTIVTSAIDHREVWQYRKKNPEIRFIVINRNRGFAATVNIGFRVSTGQWIATINDDVFFSTGWLKNLLAAKQPSTGSINPVIRKKSGVIESIGIKILPWGKAEPIGCFDHDRSKNTQSVAVDATNAAAVIYDKEALNKVGIFDERFGSYLEDIDLSLRLSRRGYKNLVSLESSVTHLGQSSSKKLTWKKNFFDLRNWILIIIKNWGIKKIIVNFPAIFIERLRNLSGIIKAIQSNIKK